jgi:hypothetical protein
LSGRWLIAEASISAKGGLLEWRGKVANLVSAAWTGNLWLPIGAVLSICHEWQCGVPMANTSHGIHVKH